LFFAQNKDVSWSHGIQEGAIFITLQWHRIQVGHMHLISLLLTKKLVVTQNKEGDSCGCRL
jgi:hypothetical protein